MTRLDFHFLGRPQIQLQGQPLELGRKPLVLLALLSDPTNGTKLPTRDILAHMLWAGKSNALGSLSTALNQIREALGFDPFFSDDKTRALGFNTEFQSDLLTQLQAIQSEEPSHWLETWQALSQEFLGFPEPAWDAKFDLSFKIGSSTNAKNSIKPAATLDSALDCTILARKTGWRHCHF